MTPPLKKTVDWVFGPDGALFRAAAIGDLALARELLEAGANPNAVSNAGFTPLHRAAQNGRGELVELLVQRGARRDARADDGTCPLDLALAARHDAVAALLNA